MSGRVYVGSSVNVEKRLLCHRYLLRRGTHWSRLMCRSWKKHGEAAFDFSLVETVEDPIFLLPREQFWIWRTRAHLIGYNTLETPDRLPGFRHSADTRASMSAGKKGKPSPKREMPISEEHRRKLLAARLAYTLTPENIANRAAAQRGLKRSLETKRRMSEARKAGLANGTIRLGKIDWTPERRAAMSVSQMGHPTSAEARRRMSEAKRGKTLSAEHRAKLSSSLHAYQARKKHREDHTLH
jgi:hypothetical protein